MSTVASPIDCAAPGLQLLAETAGFAELLASLRAARGCAGRSFTTPASQPFAWGMV
jgi:hypothetical protein